MSYVLVIWESESRVKWVSDCKCLHLVAIDLNQEMKTLFPDYIVIQILNAIEFEYGVYYSQVKIANYSLI